MPTSVLRPSGGERRTAARGRAALEYGADAEAALDVIELLDLAWQDAYGDVVPPAQLVDDLWCVAGGDLARLVHSARMAVTDWRDLRAAAERIRAER